MRGTSASEITLALGWLVHKQKRRFLIRKWSENWIVNTTRHHNKSDLLRRSDCRCFSLNSAISHQTMRPWTFEQDSLRAFQRCFKMRIWLERLFNNGLNWPYWCVVSDAFKAQRALELSNRSFHLFSELLPGEVIHTGAVRPSHLMTLGVLDSLASGCCC